MKANDTIIASVGYNYTIIANVGYNFGAKIALEWDNFVGESWDMLPNSSLTVKLRIEIRSDLIKRIKRRKIMSTNAVGV